MSRNKPWVDRGTFELGTPKQIEEMAKICTDKCRDCHNDECRKTTKSQHCIAEALYTAGYRKQSEGTWMTYHCTNGGNSQRGRTIIYKTYTCDACGKSNGRHRTNFCPNCGAKMKGV